MESKTDVINYSKEFPEALNKIVKISGPRKDIISLSQLEMSSSITETNEKKQTCKEAQR